MTTLADAGIILLNELKLMSGFTSYRFHVIKFAKRL